jgi:dTDP-4-dehydrorhamnose reductase
MTKYPPHTHGGNHVERYADVEAFRVKHGQRSGAKLLLNECWDRYHIPIAVTEVHISCDIDNQIRWFAEIRNTCMSLIEKGVDIRAVTAWSLLGSFGWNDLLRKANGDYEPGVFDISSGDLLPTPMADYLIRLHEDPDYIHPAENEKGWWRRKDRFIPELHHPHLPVEESVPDCELKGNAA